MMDGDIEGRYKVTFTSWNGLVYKLPRHLLSKCKNVEALKFTGIYFLFGKGTIYVGQAGNRRNGDGILSRLLEHNNEKELWSNAIVLTTNNNSWGPTDISYLENYYTEKVKEVGECQPLNKVIPTPGNVVEEKQAELDDYIDTAMILISMLGYNVFEKKKEESDYQLSNRVYELQKTSKRSNMEIKAQMVITDKGYKVLEGSIIELISLDTISDTMKARRKEALVDKEGRLLKSYTFNSASTAAAFVVGQSVNGRTAWRCDGKKLSDIEKEEKIFEN